ncbi:MAG: translational GTPase TypA [Chitinispirillaceae bacterium]|jgi:GTP-binding protein|nr:translational GTPase TypA [Chitinispirillaceae bacterium]
MRKHNFRNIAIIAHVDHGKTTLLDGMLKQSGTCTFRDNQDVEERIMDSMDLEKERGITIQAKNTSVVYKGVKINIVDTPGHADFGGEVERSLNLVDGVLLLVDASEGPLPQTRFVLRKALEKNLPVILVINKIDRPDARIDVITSEVYDLFIDLDATEEQIEFPIIYTNAKTGVAHLKLDDENTDLTPLFEAILHRIPGPEANDEVVPQFLVTNLGYDSYVGQIAIGRLTSGILEPNKTYSLCGKDAITHGVKITVCYTFTGLQKTQMTRLEAGDIIAIAGIENVQIGDTISSDTDPQPLHRIQIDEPTVSMIFYVNAGPMSGREGTFVTSRHLSERLQREMLGNVSMKLKRLDRTDAWEVCGRGELQMAVLIETMRREGYEMMVSKPRVITKEKDGKIQEPVERVCLDIPDDRVGIITEKLSSRKGRMVSMQNHGHGRVSMDFIIPSRGLIGFRSQFLTDTKGAGIMNTIFEGYADWFGPIPQRTNGAMVADRPGKVTNYAILGMSDRGELIVDVGTDVYEGMVIGERNRPDDMAVNIAREKKLTNMRSSTSEATIVLRPPRIMSLDQSIEFIQEDELVEVTPKSVRIRKFELDASKRATAKNKEKKASGAYDE